VTFGYLGYIWAMLGCGCFALVVGGAAAVLYGVARRDREARGGPTITVDPLKRPGGDPPGAA
jgi:hypothetical protein